MSNKAKNVDNYERLFKTVSDAKTYSKALAIYIDRKTAVTKEILDVMLDVYSNDVLYVEGTKNIDPDILSTDLQYVPISVVPTLINETPNRNFESMYVTASELAIALHGAIMNDDPDTVRLNLVNWENDCTFDEIVQSCCDSYQEFRNGYVDEVSFFNPFDFSLSDANSNVLAQPILNRGMYTLTISDFNKVKDAQYRRSGTPPVIVISVSQTLQRLADTVNQNKLTTMLFNILGSSKNVTRADIVSEATRVLGDAMSRTISLDDSLYNIAVDDGIPIADRISYMVENLNDQAQTTDQDLDDQVHDDVINGITFNATDYTHKTASSMWNGAVAGNVIVKACLVCANVIKSVCKVVFNVVKAVFRGLKRLWNKFVKPTYQSKDFVASESDDTDNYVDVPLFMVQDLEFDRQSMADMVYAGLLNSMEYKYTIPSNDKLVLDITGDRYSRVITAPDISGFSKAITDTNATENEQMSRVQRFKLQTRWEVEGTSYKSVKDSFNLPSLDYQSHIRGAMTAHVDLPCCNCMIGDVGLSKVYDASTVDTTVKIYGSQDLITSSNQSFSMYVEKGSSIVRLEKRTRSGSLFNPTYSTSVIGEIHLQDGWKFDDIDYKSAVFGGLYSVSYTPVSSNSIPDVPGVKYTDSRGTLAWSIIAVNPNNTSKLRIYMEAPIYWYDPSKGSPPMFISMAMLPTIKYVEVIPNYVHLGDGLTSKVEIDLPMWGTNVEELKVGPINFAGMVECTPCVHVIFPTNETNFQLVSNDANVVIIEEQSSKQRYSIECANGAVKLYTGDHQHNCTFDPWADWTNGRYEYFEPPYYTFHDTIDVCYRNERSSNAYVIATHKLSYAPEKAMNYQLLQLTYSETSHYVIDGVQHIETEWLDKHTVVWHSRPIETISKSSLYNLLSDCSNPIDIGCTTVFRFKFGCMEMYSSSDNKLTCVAYLNPIDHTQLFDSNLEWLPDITADDDALFNAMQSAFTTKSEWTSDESGDVLAYKDIVASYKLWDLVMWMLCNPHLYTVDYFGTQYPVYLTDKTFKLNVESVDRKDFVDAIYTDSISIEKASNFFYCMLYYIISNKPAYMRIYYILTGSFPTFIPYLVGDRLLTPKWHIQTDDDIQKYVDNFATALVVAAAVIAASVILGLGKKAIKKKVRLKQLDKNNQVMASKTNAVNKLNVRNGKQKDYDDAANRLKKLNASSPEYASTLNEVKEKKAALIAARSDYKNSLVSQAKDERSLARFEKLTSFLGVTASTSVCKFDSGSEVEQLMLLSEDEIANDEIDSASDTAAQSKLAEIGAYSMSISNSVTTLSENVTNIQSDVEGLGSDVAEVYAEIENVSTKQDTQSVLSAIAAISSGLTALHEFVAKSKSPKLDFGM